MMAACAATLGGGNSIMIFPEGTRSLDGELGAFRHGAFTLAVQYRVAIVPIVTDGTLDALPKHGMTLHNAADIVIQVLDPIDVAGFTEVDALRDHVRGVMEEALRALRAERRARLAPPPASSSDARRESSWHGLSFRCRARSNRGRRASARGKSSSRTAQRT
jgi:1-acyl-sn-glycerol-3-phosphate acyltransferase